MKTALTVITTAILTAIAFLFAWQSGFLGNNNTITTLSSETTQIGQNGLSNLQVKCDLDENGGPCTTPWGENIAHGQSILSFQNNTGNNEYQCQGITSTCNDGSWRDGKKPYDFSSCTLSGSAALETGKTILPSKNCTIGDIIIPHDTTYTFYKEIRKNGKYIYETSKRYCFDGKLEGDNTFDKINTLSSCQPATTPIKKVVPIKKIIKKPIYKPASKPIVKPTPKFNRCTSPSGKVWNHGESASYYTNSSVAYGKTCKKIQVVCGYGSLRSGSVDGPQVSGPFATSCSVGSPKKCTTSCGEVDHGANITTYSKGILSHGGGEVCNDLQIVSTCTNGSLNIPTGNFCSCKVAPPAGCTAANGTQVAHNGSMTLYQYPEVQALPGDGTDMCVRQWRKCVNGTWHNRGGSPASFTFKYPTCTVIAPPEGGGPGGEGVPQG